MSFIFDDNCTEGCPCDRCRRFRYSGEIMFRGVVEVDWALDMIHDNAESMHDTIDEFERVIVNVTVHDPSFIDFVKFFGDPEDPNWKYRRFKKPGVISIRYVPVEIVKRMEDLEDRTFEFSHRHGIWQSLLIPFIPDKKENLN